MNGLTAFIAGIVAIIAAFFFGRFKGSKETETKIKGEVMILTKEKEIQNDVTPIVTQAVKEQAEAQVRYQEDMAAMQELRESGNIDDMGRITAELAQKAIGLGATPK